MDLDYFRKINRLGNGNTTRNSLIESMVEDYNIAHDNLIHRFDIRINSISALDCYFNMSEDPIKAVIDEKKDYTSSSNIEETIQTYPNLIKTGYYFKMKRNETDNDNYYLITSEIKKQDGYDEGVFLKCNQTFKWKDENGIHVYPCVSSNDSYGVKQATSSGTLTELEIKLKIKIQNNEDTRKLMPNLRIMFSHSKTDIYKIISINKSIYEGVITITCVNDEYRPLDDDLENNLCSQNDSNNSNNNTPIEPTDYEIIGENSFKHLTQSVYTLNPVNNNCVWSLDQDSIDLEIARIDSQDSTSCTVYGYQTSSSEFFTLYAKDGDNVLAEKTITIKKNM